jgi:hypothetical protein
MLTNRIDYRNTRVFNQLRRDVSTVASAVFRARDGDQEALSIGETMKVTSALLRNPSQARKAQPFRIRLVAAATPEKRSTTHHHAAQKHSKKHRGKWYGRSRQA